MMQGDRAEHERVISHSPTFHGLPREMLSALLDRMEERSFAPGEPLIRQDAPGDALYVLLHGSATVEVDDGGRGPRRVAEVRSGEVIGELALISGERRTASVIAREGVRVLALDAEDFHRICRRHPRIAVVLTRLVADRLGGDDRDVLGGKVIEGYTIVRCIGRGGMAIVYEAVRGETGQRFALKMMSHSLVYDELALRRFGSEAELLAGLDHDNLCRMLDRFAAYGTSFLVIEYCDGPSLRTVAERRVAIDEPSVRALVGQLARALDYVHSRGVVHHDVKPSNVLLTRRGQVKLADFGIARASRDVADSTLTNEPAIVGTPHYMAPEQFRDEQRDHRVDHYALACMAYELLAGRPLFEGRGMYEIIREKEELELPAAAEIGRGISPEMHEFLARNLAPAPAARSATLAAQVGWAAPVDLAALEEPV